MAFTQIQLHDFFLAFEQGNAALAAGYFAENGVLQDALFPKTIMHGRDAIAGEIKKVAGLLKESSFTVKNFHMTKDVSYAEVDTYHLYKGGFEANYCQMFVIESTGSGEITTARVYHSMSLKTIPKILSSAVKHKLSALNFNTKNKR